MTDVVKEKINVLSNNTPITTALAVALCGGAFWLGGQLNNLAIRVEYNEEGIKKYTEWKESSQKILNKLAEVSTDNKRRLDYLEDK